MIYNYYLASERARARGEGGKCSVGSTDVDGSYDDGNGDTDECLYGVRTRINTS